MLSSTNLRQIRGQIAAPDLGGSSGVGGEFLVEIDGQCAGPCRCCVVTFQFFGFVRCGGLVKFLIWWASNVDKLGMMKKIFQNSNTKFHKKVSPLGAMYFWRHHHYHAKNISKICLKPRSVPLTWHRWTNVLDFPGAVLSARALANMGWQWRRLKHI